MNIAVHKNLFAQIILSVTQILLCDITNENMQKIYEINKKRNEACKNRMNSVNFCAY